MCRAPRGLLAAWARLAGRTASEAAVQHSARDSKARRTRYYPANKLVLPTSGKKTHDALCTGLVASLARKHSSRIAVGVRFVGTDAHFSSGSPVSAGLAFSVYRESEGGKRPQTEKKHRLETEAAHIYHDLSLNNALPLKPSLEGTGKKKTHTTLRLVCVTPPVFTACQRDRANHRTKVLPPKHA